MYTCLFHIGNTRVFACFTRQKLGFAQKIDSLVRTHKKHFVLLISLDNFDAKTNMEDE